MVLPAELCYAKYAKPVLLFLARSFGRVMVLTFREKLFAHLNESTVLLLCDERGGMTQSFECLDFQNGEALRGHDFTRVCGMAASRHALPITGSRAGNLRFNQCFLSEEQRDLFDHLRSHDAVSRLGVECDVGIGYVTGANAFFHVRESELQLRCIPSSCLLRAVFRNAALNGLRFLKRDWGANCESGMAGWLLYLEPEHGELPESVVAYLRPHQAAISVYGPCACAVMDQLADCLELRSGGALAGRGHAEIGAARSGTGHRAYTVR